MNLPGQNEVQFIRLHFCFHNAASVFLDEPIWLLLIALNFRIITFLNKVICAGRDDLPAEAIVQICEHIVKDYVEVFEDLVLHSSLKSRF